MKLCAHKFALAAAIASGFGYALCALLMLLWPGQSLQFMASLMHMTSLSILAPYFQVTIFNFISGIIQCMLYSYVYVFVFALIYNQLLNNAR